MDRLVEDGWNYHDSETERLAAELEAAAEAGVADIQLAPFLALALHTIGEHLADWPRALELSKRVLAGRQPDMNTARAWGRLYVAASLAGDALLAAQSELLYLATAGDDFGAALLDMRFMLAAALVGTKRSSEAARIFRGALELVPQIHPSTMLDRTIAVASNNLGWELYETVGRGEDENALLRLCGRTSLQYWLKCGNWINEEKALYLNSLIANEAGNPRAALAHADLAIAVIETHGERPLDLALLHLARASSLASLGDLEGRSLAIESADLAAAKLTAPDLQREFAAQREKAISGF